MTKMMVKAALAMALLAGCGGTGLRNAGGDEAVDDTPAIGSSSEALSVDLRVKGTKVSGYSNVLIAPVDVKVWADGRLLQVEHVGDVVNLADTSHAEKIATVLVPKDAKVVEFAIDLGPAGGFDGAAGSGWIDTRSRVIRFKSSIENLAEKNKAVVEFDAEKSFIVRDATTLSFVPRYRVMY